MEHTQKEIKISLSKKAFDKFENQIKKISRSFSSFYIKEEYFDTKDMKFTNLNRSFLVRFLDEAPSILEFRSLFYQNTTFDTQRKWYTEKMTLSLPININDLDTLNDILSRMDIPALNLETNVECIGYFEFKDQLKDNGLVPRLHITRNSNEYVTDKFGFRFDTIEELGTFILIESKSEEYDLLEFVKSVPLLKGEKTVHAQYYDILARNIKACLTTEQKKFLFSLNPSWNMFVHELDFVKKLFDREN